MPDAASAADAVAGIKASHPGGDVHHIVGSGPQSNDAGGACRGLPREFEYAIVMSDDDGVV
jgi:hypothetical protein